MSDRVLGQEILKQVMEWYAKLDVGQAEVYHICVGLTILEFSASSYPIKRTDYITPGTQVRTSGAKIKRILARYGEKRLLASEGGRTTRAALGAAEALVERLNSWARAAEFQALSEGQRREAVRPAQAWLTAQATAFLDRKKLAVEIALAKPAKMIIGDILEVAGERRQAGAVAQHLVGAKLALRYPDMTVENHSYTTADRQLHRPGDFVIGDTVFHVTVAPMPPLFEKVAANLREGYRVKILVTDRRLNGARDFADAAGVAGRVDVASIEEFVGQNIEELAEFAKGKLSDQFLALLNLYNQRVRSVETDTSLQIEIPRILDVRHRD